MIRLGLDRDLPWNLAADDARFIDALDATLDVIDWEVESWRNEGRPFPGDLERILAVGNSALRVSDSFFGLERRVDPTATAAFAEIVKASPQDAADHLASAWAKAMSANQDADGAYREAVLAVEAVACPLVAPASNRATLGTVIADLRNQASKWEVVFTDTSGQRAGIESLIGMLVLLWQGQSRHAGGPNSRRQTAEEAVAAVHLAATLVQWLSSGVLTRKP